MKPHPSFPWLATGLTLISAVILCGLGLWQLQRLDWKTELLSNLAREYPKDPLDHPLHAQDFLSMEQNDIRHGHVTGHFLYEQEIAIGPRIHQEELGYEIYIPFTLETGKTLLVHQGWTKEKSTRHQTETGLLSLSGTARMPSKPWKLGIHNQPDQNMWVYLDMEDIAQTVPDLLPVVFYRENTQWIPNNNHLRYALFWFAMCGIMLVIYYVRFWKI